MNKDSNKIKRFVGFAVYAIIFASLIWLSSIGTFPPHFGKVRSASIFRTNNGYSVERNVEDGRAKGWELFAIIALNEDAQVDRNRFRALLPNFTYTYSIDMMPTYNNPNIMAASNEWRPLVANLLAPQLLHSDFVSELSKRDVSQRLVHWPSIVVTTIRLVLIAILIRKVVVLWKCKRRDRRDRLISSGYCPACLYDLRWATHEYCPECGLKCEDSATQTETIEA